LRRSLRRDVCPTSCCRGGTAVRVPNFRSRWNDRSTGSNASLRRPGRTRLSVDCAPWLNAPTQHRGGIDLRRDGRARLQNSRFRKCSRSPPHSIRMRLSRFPVVPSATPSRPRAYSTSSRIVAWCWHPARCGILGWGRYRARRRVSPLRSCNMRERPAPSLVTTLSGALRAQERVHLLSGCLERPAPDL
jgi:hypothetical protein